MQHGHESMWSICTEAAFSGDASMIDDLHEFGEDLAAADKLGNTPATAAASRGHVNVLRQLFKHGIRLDVPDGRRNTPACLAACKGHVAALRALAECKVDLAGHDGFGNTPATWAAASGHADVLQELHLQGVKVNEQDQLGHTPVMRAAARGHVGVGLAKLGRHGVDLGEVDSWGYTPAAVAATFGEVGTIHELGRQRADLDRPCGNAKWKLTPAAIAARAGHVDVLEELLMNGIDLHAPEPEVIRRNGKMENGKIGDAKQKEKERQKKGKSANQQKESESMVLEEEVFPMDLARGASQHGVQLFLDDVMLGNAQKRQFVRWWFDAVEDGNLASLASLFKQMPELAYRTNAAGQTALTVAASMDQADVVRELRVLAGSEYLQCNDKKGLTVVTQAIESQALSVMQELLRQLGL
eukprot:g1337.t1